MPLKAFVTGATGFLGSHVARVLADRGMLKKGPGDKFTRSERLPGSKGTTRCYVVLSRILGATDDER